MFSSQEYIDNKTGRDDLSRFQYLQALVTEFQDTSSDGIYILCFWLTSHSDFVHFSSNVKHLIQTMKIIDGISLYL